MRQLAKDPGHHGQVLEVVVGLEQRVALHSRRFVNGYLFPIIDKAVIKAMK